MTRARGLAKRRDAKKEEISTLPNPTVRAILNEFEKNAGELNEMGMKWDVGCIRHDAVPLVACARSIFGFRKHELHGLR